MVEEVINQKLFNYQNVRLINSAMALEDVPDQNKEEFISKSYNHIIHDFDRNL